MKRIENSCNVEDNLIVLRICIAIIFTDFICLGSIVVSVMDSHSCEISLSLIHSFKRSGFELWPGQSHICVLL